MINITTEENTINPVSINVISGHCNVRKEHITDIKHKRKLKKPDECKYKITKKEDIFTF